jgi:chromosome segregation ATPase
MGNAKVKMDEVLRSDHNLSRATVYVCLALAFAACCALAVGWALHCSKYTDANEKLAASNQTLNGRIETLQEDLDELKEETAKVLSELTGSNSTLAGANETLAKNLTAARESLESAAWENISLTNDIRRLHAETGRITSDSTKNITELTAAVVKLTDELNAANNRLDGLVENLQAKTDEAAELSTKVNTLVEMVARLRVMLGLTTESIEGETAGQAAGEDPNSPATVPLEESSELL